jgi:hypothetical protein
MDLREQVEIITKDLEDHYPKEGEIAAIAKSYRWALTHSTRSLPSSDFSSSEPSIRKMATRGTSSQPLAGCEHPFPGGSLRAIQLCLKEIDSLRGTAYEPHLAGRDRPRSHSFEGGQK